MITEGGSSPRQFITAIRRCTLVITMVAVAGDLPAAAQHGQHPADAMTPHHCRYAPAISFTSLPPAVPLDGIGTSSLKITTGSRRAQEFFDQGLRLLHCFWDAEAYRAFREAARADPNCPMAYWGIFSALAQNGQESAAERAEALRKAVELSGRASEHERYYIRAAALLAEPGKGRSAWVGEMEALIDRFPEDVEAKLLLANALSSPPSSYSPDGRPREGKLYGQAILRHLLVTHPNHAAVHHYWIHALENGPRPQDALASALKLPRLAPGSGHMLHMPGHIYYRLGRYGQARAAFLASMRRDLAYMKRQRINPLNNWNYVHNLDYLVGNCAEDGRYREGVRWAKLLQAVTVDQERLKAGGAGYILYGGHTALARLQMRYRKWDEAAESLSQTVNQDTHSGSLSQEYTKGFLHYLRGMAAVEQGRESDASAHARMLEELSKQASDRRAQLGADWYFAHAARVLAVQAADLRGSLLGLQGQYAQAVELLREASRKEKALGYWEPPHYARPVLESLGRVHMLAGEYGLAKEAYREELKLRPASGHALWGLAVASDRAGDRAEAARYYRRFLRSWRDADADLPQVSAARAWLKQNVLRRR